MARGECAFAPAPHSSAVCLAAYRYCRGKPSSGEGRCST
eukprot:CAMPEP_0185316586 /NCGR_PEP_ID=MMETSP1363-20130426/44510_1 /TAXON_ID=38817 /ORGANISM="Gephyrocapsa oceanica, Strain RCC1303" /LENGTH=38 /DNA_ID= /DNA_START= /DNA_END= /DNA_ORIENTATION=